MSVLAFSLSAASETSPESPLPNAQIILRE